MSKGPDFPTGGIIIGNSGIRSAYLTGKGSILIRGKTSIESAKKKRKYNYQRSSISQ